MLLQLFKTLLLQSAIGAILTLVLLLLKPVTQRIFGSCWQYYIWLCVLLVMILPITVQSPVKPVVNVPAPQQTESAQAGETPEVLADTGTTASRHAFYIQAGCSDKRNPTQSLHPCDLCLAGGSGCVFPGEHHNLSVVWVNDTETFSTRKLPDAGQDKSRKRDKRQYPDSCRPVHQHSDEQLWYRMIYCLQFTGPRLEIERYEDNPVAYEEKINACYEGYRKMAKIRYYRKKINIVFRRIRRII